MTVSELIKRLEEIQDKDREVVIVGEDAQVFEIEFIEDSTLQDDLLIYVSKWEE